MGYYVGLDVSLKSTHICVLDGERRVIWRGVSDTQIAMIAEHLARWGEQIVLVGLETGSLTPWLYHGLSDLGLPMVCMDARRASDALKARAEKTDKADARSTRAGCFWLESRWGFPNRVDFDSTCWLGGGQQECRSRIRKICATA